MTASAAGGAGVFAPLDRDDLRTVAGYRIRARLGAGGMGKVYLSYTPGGRPVAIKVIRPEFAQDPEFRRRFRSEVQAVQRVQGLCTAPVIDSDTEGPVPWLATAYVPGPPLGAAVGTYGPLPVDTALLLVAGIAEALGVIHGAGVVHRDLKPSNVLLAADGPRVIDFGIARAADATALTGSGVAVGTPAFMAPEQAAGRPVTAATDVFALGQVAVYAATGRPAFGEGASHGVLYRIVHEEPELSLLPAELRTLAEGCLRKDPEGRPSVPEVIGICREAADSTQLRRVEDWLPAPVAADIVSRAAVPVSGPTAPLPGQRAVPGEPAGHAPPFGTGFGPAAGFGPHSDADTAGLAQTPPMGFGPPLPGPWPAQPSGPSGQFAPAPPACPDGEAGRLKRLVRGLRSRSARTVAIVVLAFACGAATAAELTGDGGDSAPGAAPSPPAGSPDTAAGSGGGGAEPGARVPRPGAEPSQLVRPRPVPKPEEYDGLNLPDDYHLAFADRPVRPSDSPDDREDVAYETELDRLGTADSNKLVLLDDEQPPTLRTCRSETRFAQRVELRSLSKGARICVLNGAGHVGLVTFRGTSPDSDPSTYVKLDLTVWRNALDVSEEEPTEGP
ncbi:serine/threonine-protein kinase [Streptomyces xiaopingdaonensis]|uniref:serine/threonine-protein kinase n=1 Tax=Streptomyces xiaopingdaonensis TaxID=1565415 RepID=UPI00031EA31D|nr:serine/threonine-protein kinase [Streptomyces xiaopingdaonensis]